MPHEHDSLLAARSATAPINSTWEASWSDDEVDSGDGGGGGGEAVTGMRFRAARGCGSGRVRLYDKEPVLSFTDALFSVIATILAATLILSKSQVKDLEHSDTLSFVAALASKVYEGVLLIIVINIVYVYWLRSVRLFSLVESASPLTIAAHMTTILLLGVLPLSASIAASTFVKSEALASYRSLAGTVLITNFLAVALASLATTLAALRFDATFTGGYPLLALRKQEIRVILEVAVHLIILIIALASDTVFPWIYIGYLAIPLAIAAHELYSWSSDHPQFASYRAFIHRVPLVRLNQLADGVFAVVATLIVLDIRIPDDFLSRGYRLDEFLLAAGPRLLGYAFAFVVSGILWYQNRIVFSHCIEHQSLYFFLVTLESLAISSFLPFAASVIVHFPDSRVAACLCIGVVLLASLLQLASLSLAQLMCMLPLASLVAFVVLWISPVAAVCCLALPLPVRLACLFLGATIPRASLDLASRAFSTVRGFASSTPTVSSITSTTAAASLSTDPTPSP
ncbi:uncharacterized protein AMSG_09431 [Thecamonas trahens ATCC 50062]|uniref:Endosomal/lysosomal proton channel TMEM175 n=1 Tax=Thecamonas trahens ATCC 50062 TaxID=461836 RepID=A0A0L0DM91_THETB|nr:hypothetical protein AMSG_09431 [Thecamonas trahens ATCC 50062]KNC53126.1 hypothetical protein AMSG_09431 [Thecamonas trahens ATCC 50062]|eukprot:XP_013754793.1 hypothetical protein AMSG_09431 [Thecamonas trahens ATCC 50062]